MTLPVDRSLVLLALTAVLIACNGCTSRRHVATVIVEPVIEENRFAASRPAGWSMDGGWEFSGVGATAVSPAEANWDGELVAGRLLELIFDLPDRETQEPPDDEKPKALAYVTLTVGNDTDDVNGDGAVDGNDRINLHAQYLPHRYRADFAGPDPDGKIVKTETSGDTRPSVLRAWEEAEDHPGWAGQTVSLGLTLDPGACRLFINGSEAARIAAVLPSQRRVRLNAKGITLRSVRVLGGGEGRDTMLTATGMAMLNGGHSAQQATGIAAGEFESALIRLDGVPMIVRGAADGRLATIDVSAERHKSGSWSEGTGMLTAPATLDKKSRFATAHLLIHRPDNHGDKTCAMGFGLRVPEWATGDLKNIYVGETPVRYGDEGVTVRPVPELGRGWYHARVALNPAALLRPDHHVYLNRPWTAYDGIPTPTGQASAMHVAAITLVRSRIEMTLTGNGLGNVYCRPDQPQLTATARNLTDEPLAVQVSTELIPFDQKPVRKRWTLKLAAGEAKTFDALAAPISRLGHYRVRVVADGGNAGRIDHRTNVALLAPDTRLKVDSPFGCWGKLWTDQSTDEQRAYLYEKAGVAFIMGKHNAVVRLTTQIPDDAAAEKIVKGFKPEAEVLMLGWEHNWGIDQTFAFPRVILEGKIEQLKEETWENVDQTAEQWRRLIDAVRRHRPDLKISLGNSGVNFTVPFLERGFKHGREFDYFGTEETYAGAMPEEPATAIGNVNWWVKAICEHYGFRNVPIFHSESIYISTGAGLTRMSDRTQAARYVRAYLLGLPYDSNFGLSGAMIDSSNRYVYSIWGATGYCNQAPECSPKLSYVAFATLTQLLDGARYERTLHTGTTSVYALRFRRNDGTPIHVLWNLYGRRRAELTFAGAGKPVVVDALNRPVRVRVGGRRCKLTLCNLPLYVIGVDVERVNPGGNVAQSLPQRRLLSPLEDLSDWTLSTQPDEDFEKPREWMGVPKVMGRFDVIRQKQIMPPDRRARAAVTFALRAQDTPHGLIPRYVSLESPAGREIAIPAGTTRLGMWVHGQSTWARLRLGLENAEGKRELVSLKSYECFDGWRFLQTDMLGDDVQRGASIITRLVVTVPVSQVYVDELVTTPHPRIAIWGLHASDAKPPAPNYLPW